MQGRQGEQLTLVQLPSTRTPIRYFGSKINGIKVLLPFIPQGVTEVLSPFLGSGALELALTARGVRVRGYDKFQPVTELWQVLLSDPGGIVRAMRAIASVVDANQVFEYCKACYADEGCAVRRAAMSLMIWNISFNSAGFRGQPRRGLEMRADGLYHYKKREDRYWKVFDFGEIAAFQNPLITVGCMDFRESLAAHPDMFAYMDPPYPVSACHYGDSPEYHSEFPHADLAAILHARRDWVLSYNDVELIRELYPPAVFDWTAVQWQQGSRLTHDTRGNDVIIRPRTCPP